MALSSAGVRDQACKVRMHSNARLQARPNWLPVAASSSRSASADLAKLKSAAHCWRLEHGRSPVAMGAASSEQTLPPVIPVKAVRRVRLKTRSDCGLGISVYPDFVYNATGGGGWAEATDLGDGQLRVTFDASTLVIPDLSWRTTTLFFVPIPPPLNIAITPKRLEGVINTLTGEVNLEFDAEFIFTAGPLYTAPPLVVKTVLTTEVATGRQRSGIGSRVVNNAVRLAGVSNIDKTGDLFMDNFLMLPADALALMSGELEFQT